MIFDGFVVKQRELYKFWGYGQELCQLGYGSIVGYLEKYVGKNVEEYGELGRRFGSSVLGWWAVARWAFECVREFWAAGLDVVKVRFCRSELGRLLYVTVTDGVTMECYRVPSPWVRVYAS